jgi:hypothetical protein
MHIGVDMNQEMADKLLVKTKQLATLIRLIREENGMPGLALTELENDTLEVIAEVEGGKK